MARFWWVGVLLALSALLLPTRARALRCGTHIVEQGDTVVQVRDKCGDPFFVDYYVGPPGVGVERPVEPGAAVTAEVWYYNFGPQRLMVRLEFSGGVLAREQPLGYGFVGNGGPCDFTGITIGMSVADLIARCGLAPRRARNPLAIAAYMGSQAPAWGEAWFYPADGSRAAREIRLQDGRVTDIEILH
ncbi:MAG TPA: DUF2845 domain-containing protein [Rhodanobacteraceae bacterium]|nr:DUF2845 domain-containing protein [Rhodanobacteraceae bacterium]